MNLTAVPGTHYSQHDPLVTNYHVQSAAMSSENGFDLGH
jgi:hypothetical protein